MKNKIMKLQNGSDIRGIADNSVEGETANLTELEAAAIGAAFGWWLSFKVVKNPFDLNVCIGRDPRESGDIMVRGLMKGLQYIGAHIAYTGLASTPAMFMACSSQVFEYDGAIMVTASHLPRNRNGFKFFSPEGGLEADDIRKILEHASKINMIGEYYEYEKIDLMQFYTLHMRTLIKSGVGGSLEGLHVVVDAGNGAGGFFATEVLEPLGADISGSQFLEPDGSFPNHVPNPENTEAMASVCEAVKKSSADLGLIFDTDVDRSAAVDGSGKPIARNEIVALAAALRADKYPGGTVVTDSITSEELHEFLENDLGLRHLRYKRGYRNVINKAIEISAQGNNSEYGEAFLAIETSGHAAYSENNYLDDGAFLACLIVIAAAKLKKEGKGIETLIENLKKPADSKEFRLKIAEDKISEDSLSECAKVKSFTEYADVILNSLEYWANETDGLEVVKPNYEGVRVNFKLDGKRGWFLMRKSLHDPVMPVNIESAVSGGSKKAAAMLKEFLSNLTAIDSDQLEA